MASFGEKIRKLRRDGDFTQKDVADYLGIQGAAVGKYESGKDSYPSAKMLVKLADFFNVSIDYLLRDEQPIQANISANNSFIRSNVQADNGSVIVNGQALSDEESELIRVYKSLKVKGRNELLNFAYKLEDQAKAL